jgi:hypothetical protein
LGMMEMGELSYWAKAAIDYMTVETPITDG